MILHMALANLMVKVANSENLAFLNSRIKNIKSLNHAKSTMLIKLQPLVILFTRASVSPVFPRDVYLSINELINLSINESISQSIKL